MELTVEHITQSSRFGDEVFCMDSAFDPEEFKEMMKTIRTEGFDPKYF